jgi:hypothetical protein
MVRAAATTNSAPIVARVRIFIAREPQAVFDYFADLRNEPQYNSNVSAIQKISPGKIGHGSTFEGLHRGLGRVTWKLAEYERPTHVAMRVASVEGLIVGRATSEPPKAGRG